jgi:dienelactone hydrolase
MVDRPPRTSKRGFTMPSGEGPHPAVVLAHGIGAIKACGLAPFAERFCQAGFVAIAIDYRHWGGSSGEPRDILFYSKQREDCRTAIDWAAANPRIDSERSFLWGVSFAGMHVVEIADWLARVERGDIIVGDCCIVVAQRPDEFGVFPAARVAVTLLL